MGKRKRSERTTAVTAERQQREQHDTAADGANDGDDEEAIVMPRRSQRTSASSSSSSLSSSAATDGEQAAADEDELSVHIIERPAGYVPPSRVGDSDGDDEDDDSSESEAEEEEAASSLHINAMYAAKYESEKRQQEMSRKAQRGRRQSGMLQLVQEELSNARSSVHSQHGAEEGDDAVKGEDAEEEDEDEEEEDDSGALLTPALDVRIHETLNAIKRKDPIVYDRSRRFFAEDEQEDGKEEQKQSEKPTPAVTVRDLLLQSMRDEDDEEEEEKRQRRPLTHVQEQEALKQSLLKATGGGDGEEDDDELFTVRVRDSDSAAVSPSSSSAVAPLSSAEFLRSFLSEQWWRQPASALPSYERIKGEAAPPLLLQPDSEDDADVEQGEEWEQRYNFRYQEEGGSRVQTYPRDVADSLRRKDNRRKVRRERKKERKEQERRRQEEELKRLKRERMRQLEERLARIAEAGGVELQQGAAATRLQLDGAWDEAEHESAMAAMFGQDYYDQQPDDDAAIAQLLRDDQAEDGESAAADRRRPLSFASASASLSAARQQGLDAVYALEYEDVIADGLRTRFHYTQVAPDSFGLTLQQLLLRDDRELNKIVGLKKLAPYRAEADDAAAAGGGRRSRWSRWAAQAGIPQQRRKKKQKAGRTEAEGRKGPEAQTVAAAEAVQATAGNGKLSDRQKRRLREKKRRAATGSAAGSSTEAAAAGSRQQQPPL